MKNHAFLKLIDLQSEPGGSIKRPVYCINLGTIYLKKKLSRITRGTKQNCFLTVNRQVTCKTLVVSHMTPYSLYRLVHYFWQWPIGLWSKVAHYIGNRVPVGMHPQSVWGWRVGRMKEETQGMMGMLPWATRLEDPERTDGERKTGGWWHRDGGMTDWRESEVWCVHRESVGFI